MMNKKFTLSTLFFFSLLIVNAQDFVELATGASYANQAYYSFSNDEVTSIDNESWDLAFTTGATDAGILFNESVKTSHSAPPPFLKLYLAPTNDFANVIEVSELTDSLYNLGTSWEDGAFNSVKDSTSQLDFGWGAYNPANHVIEGSRVYALKLRNDSWIKIKIESLSQGVYTMKYAALDGANEARVTINKADFADSPIALFSFETATTIASPTNWDLVFGRYSTPLDAGGEIVQYSVTGILTAPGVEVAEARNVETATVDHEAYLDSLKTDIDIIGHDWKAFDLGSFMWAIDLNRVYFVKLPNNHLWKTAFIDFEGSSSGKMVFEKTDLGELTAVKNIESNFTEFGVFPNPVETEFTMSFSLKTRRENMPVQLINSLGQQVWKTSIDADRGLNVINIQKPNLPTGIYRLITGEGLDLWATSLFLK